MLIYAIYNNNNNVDYSCSQFLFDDIKSFIMKLKTGVGYDGVHSNHLKFLSDENLTYLTDFFNMCFMHQYVPRQMMKAVVRPLIKNKFGDANDSSNYREIMISSNMFKLLELCLLPIIKRHTRLSNFQFGYRSNTSTTMATALLKETVGRFINEGSVVYSGFLDLSKAFERVRHSLLFRKLVDANVPAFVINILNSMFVYSSVCVDYNGKTSFEWPTLRGLRQGGILSAHLFTFYVDEILREVNNMPYACKLGINKVNVLAYADDFVVLSPSCSGLQKILQTLNNCFLYHGLLVNAGKTKILTFKKSRNPPECKATFLIGDSPLEQVHQFKYLGSVITYNLCEKHDIARLRDSFNRRVGMFYRKFHTVEQNLKFKLLNSLCMSFYGSDLWIDTRGAVKQRDEFGVSYHYALKKVLNLPKRFSNHIVCMNLGVLVFKHFLNFNVFKFMNWLSRCVSPCFETHKMYFMKSSLFRKCIDRISSENYGIRNILDNDFEAVVARLYYVQSNEESSLYTGL